MIDAATFRQNLPAFSNTTTFPDDSVNFWIAVATMLLPVQTWGQGATPASAPTTTLLDMGLTLFVAHNLALEAKNNKAAAAGGIPGTSASGPVSSESVGSVSRSYDAALGALDDAGPWNLTTYGTRFLFLARIIGKGPVQIGADCVPLGYPWFGPPVSPYGPNGF